MDELIKKGAVELSRLIKNGSTSSEEVVKAHLKRIKEVNAKGERFFHYNGDEIQHQILIDKEYYNKNDTQKLRILYKLI